MKFTRQAHDRKEVEIKYIPTSKQLADRLTKKLSKGKNKQLVSTLLYRVD